MNSADKKKRTHQLRFAVIGAGGAGINMLKQMTVQLGMQPDVQYFAVDTDAQALAACDGVEHIHLSTQSTQGMSTGGQVEEGRRAARQHADRLKTVIAPADMVIVLAGLGGGTGTAIAEFMAEKVAEAGVLLLGFLTLPFDYEGPLRMQHATKCLKTFCDMADGAVLYPNERLMSIAADEELVGALQKVASAVVANVVAMYQLLTRRSLINLDFADVRCLLRESDGICVMSTVVADGADRLQLAMDAILSGGAFSDKNVLKKTDAVIVGVSGGQDMTLAQVEQVCALCARSLPTKMCADRGYLDRSRAVGPAGGYAAGCRIFCCTGRCRRTQPDRCKKYTP